MRRSRLVPLLVFSWLVSACADTTTPVDSDAGDETASSVESLRSGTPSAGPLAVVRVRYGDNELDHCTGALITRRRVVTVAHCLCVAHDPGDARCHPTAHVQFLPHPATNVTPPWVEGTVYGRTDFDVERPGGWDESINDLVVIDLPSDAPSYITPLTVRATPAVEREMVLVAGAGASGFDCDAYPRTLNTQPARVTLISRDGRGMWIDARLMCNGDAGAPVMDAAGTTLLGILSSERSVVKAMHAHAYREWLLAPEPLPHTVPYPVPAPPPPPQCPRNNVCCESGPSGTCSICRPTRASCP